MLAMKVHVEMDMTPEEARALMGLPDVAPLQKKMMDEMQARMNRALDAGDPESLMRAWMPLGRGRGLRAVPEIPLGQRQHGRPGRQAQGQALTLAATDVETIFALASAPGRAGVAVVRVSGPGAGQALDRAGRAAAPAPHARCCGPWRTGTPRSTRPWCCGFPRRDSFTGEDVAEFHIHGGRAVREGLFAALAELGLTPGRAGGILPPGGGKWPLDLTRAEAIADLVDAETPAQLRQALRQYDGALAELYEGWRAALIAALGRAEAAIDFSDDGVGEAEFAAARAAASGNNPGKSRHIWTMAGAAKRCAKVCGWPLWARPMPAKAR